MADQEHPEPPAVANELTQVEKDRISRWFTANASNAACPICSTEDWTVLDHLVMPIVLAGPERNSISLGAASYPHFMLTCQKCGNVQFINARRAGVVISPKSG